jgi:hypothetical protein
LLALHERQLNKKEKKTNKRTVMMERPDESKQKHTQKEVSFLVLNSAHSSKEGRLSRKSQWNRRRGNVLAARRVIEDESI